MANHLADADLDLFPASQLPEETIHWLVPNRFACGQLTILDGDPGLGKSLLMLDLAAKLSTGRPWPDGAGTPAPEPTNTIYLTAEDNDRNTLVPRLKALGADLGRIFFYHSRDRLLDQPVGFPANAGFLDHALERTGAKLVVIDPIMAFLDSGILSASDSSIRRALYPLAQLAQKHDCAIILIRHLNKKADLRSLYRGGGSIGFIAQCRSAWLVGPEPADVPRPPVLGLLSPVSDPAFETNSLNPADDAGSGTRCVLAQLKNNNGPLQPSLSYEIAGLDNGCPTIIWHGLCPVPADQVAAKSYRSGQKPRARALRFLKSYLAKGPVHTQDLWAAALERDLYERTLRRAKKDLNITSKVSWFDGKRRCYWMLPGQKLSDPPGEKDPAVAAFDDALEKMGAELDRKYPPQTPLDDLYDIPEPLPVKKDSPPDNLQISPDDGSGEAVPAAPLPAADAPSQDDQINPSKAPEPSKHDRDAKPDPDSTRKKPRKRERSAKPPLAAPVVAPANDQPISPAPVPAPASPDPDPEKPPYDPYGPPPGPPIQFPKPKFPPHARWLESFWPPD